MRITAGTVVCAILGLSPAGAQYSSYLESATSSSQSMLIGTGYFSSFAFKANPSMLFPEHRPEKEVTCSYGLVFNNGIRISHGRAAVRYRCNNGLETAAGVAANGWYDEYVHLGLLAGAVRYRGIGAGLSVKSGSGVLNTDIGVHAHRLFSAGPVPLSGTFALSYRNVSRQKAGTGFHVCNTISGDCNEIIATMPQQLLASGRLTARYSSILEQTVIMGYRFKKKDTAYVAGMEPMVWLREMERLGLYTDLRFFSCISIGAVVQRDLKTGRFVDDKPVTDLVLRCMVSSTRLQRFADSPFRMDLDVSMESMSILTAAGVSYRY